MKKSNRPLKSKKIEQNKSPVEFVLYFFGAFKLHLTVISGFIILATVVDVLIPYTAKLTMDALVSNQKSSPIFLYVFFLSTLPFFKEVCWQFAARIIIYIESFIRNNIVDELLAYVESHSFSYFSSRSSSETATRITKVAESTIEAAENFTYNFFSYLTALVGSLIILWFSSPIFSFIFLIWVCIYILITLKVSKKRETLSAEDANNWSSLGGRISDVFYNFTSVILFSQKSEERRSLNNYYKKTNSSYRKNYNYGRNIMAFQAFSGALLGLTLLITALHLFFKGKVTHGDFILLYTTVRIGQEYMHTLGANIVSLYNDIGVVRNGMDHLLVPHQITNKENAKDIVVTSPSIAINNISFGYGDIPIFKDFSLTIRPYEKVGIVGYSGAGKSTLISLLVRFHEIQSGSIEINGSDISEVTLDSLRKNITIIPQDVSLFNRTLLENIKYGKIDASYEEIVQASKIAGAHDFIAKSSKGYETVAGERGILLSGGQKQRVAIARALLKNAPILILDEATAALDVATEKELQEAFSTIMKNKTTLVIAHRLSTLLNMDRIIVLDNGKIIEEGSHEQLLKKEGAYSKLWSLSTTANMLRVVE